MSCHRHYGRKPGDFLFIRAFFFFIVLTNLRCFIYIPASRRKCVISPDPRFELGFSRVKSKHLARAPRRQSVNVRGVYGVFIQQPSCLGIPTIAKKSLLVCLVVLNESQMLRLEGTLRVGYESRMCIKLLAPFLDVGNFKTLVSF